MITSATILAKSGILRTPLRFCISHWMIPSRFETFVGCIIVLGSSLGLFVLQYEHRLGNTLEGCH